MSSPLATNRQIGAALLVALAAGALSVWMSTWRGGHLLNFRTTGGDFYQNWLLGRALWSGANPYRVGCPLSPPCADNLQFYPATAGVVAMPFAFFHAGRAAALFVACSAGLLAFAILRSGSWRLPMLLSWPFFVAVANGQWAPLLVAAALLPSAQWLFAVKPQLGLALFAWRPSWRAVRLVLVLLAVSLILRPSWPLDWWASARLNAYVRSPLRWTWFAPMLLLAVIRWRTPEARLLLAMAILPQTPFAYDQLALWLIPRTHREVLNLTWFSWATFGAWLAFTFDWHSGMVFLTTWAPYVITGLYVPCLVMVLRRPNVAASPDNANPCGASHREFSARKTAARVT